MFYLAEGPQEAPAPATLREQLGDVSMETSEHGVLVSVGVERYLAPWATVQSVRFPDAPKPGEVGGGPVVEDTPDPQVSGQATAAAAIAKLDEAIAHEAIAHEEDRLGAIGRAIAADRAALARALVPLGTWAPITAWRRWRRGC